MQPFLLQSDHSRAWCGMGRKIHCRTVFVKRLAELLNEMGFMNVKAHPDGAITIDYNLHSSGMLLTLVFRFHGCMVENAPHTNVPKFVCRKFVWTESRGKYGHNMPDDSDPGEVALAIKSLHEDRIPGIGNQ